MEKVLNMYIVDEISKNFDMGSYPTLENCSFSLVSLTKKMILINISILDMVLNLIEKENFQ